MSDSDVVKLKAAQKSLSWIYKMLVEYDVFKDQKYLLKALVDAGFSAEDILESILPLASYERPPEG